MSHVALIQHLAEALVDHASAVSVREVEGHPSPVIELRVDPTDLGKVIGRRGQTARAIRGDIRPHFRLRGPLHRELGIPR